MAGPLVALDLVLAAVCALMFLVHLSLWFQTGDPAQLWLWILLVAHVPSVLMVVGGSKMGNGEWGPSLPWLLAGVATPLLPWLALRSVTEVLGLPRRGMRRMVLQLGALVGGAVTASDAWVYTRLALAHQGLTLEEHLRQVPLVSIVLSSYGVLVLVVLTHDFVAVRKTEPGISRVGTILAALCLLVAVPVTLHPIAPGRGPFLILITGFPVVAFASSAMVSKYLKALKAVRTGREEVGEYRLVRKLAEGGMGELFLAARTGPGGFNRLVALKRSREEGQAAGEWTRRFLAEARLAATLQHPNIVAVYDLGRLPDGWFIVMEYLLGVSLHLVKHELAELEEPFPVELALFVGEQVCRGLAHAHERGIVHRDISPGNIMVTFEGEVKIVDFGIAQVVREHAREQGILLSPFPSPSVTPPLVQPTQLTIPGQLMGKHGYFAPELLGGAPASPASDQFALGVVLHELLVGVRPGSRPEGDSLAMVPLLREIRPGLDPALEAILVRPLATDPKERFPSLAEMGEALNTALARLPRPDLSGWMKAHLAQAWREQSRAFQETENTVATLASDGSHEQAGRAP